jgi:putative phosphoribosyl transferase
MASPPESFKEHQVRIPAAGVGLEGDIAISPDAVGLVIFAHGSGSSRRSPRNRLVAQALQRAGLATLLFDLLTVDEELVDQRTRQHRFDIALLADRLVGVTDWCSRQPTLGLLPFGYFGASTGAAAALVAASERPMLVGAVVSRGGRPDLAGAALAAVHAPTLLIVGGADTPVIELNETARLRMRADAELRIIPDATHLFEEPGALENVAQLASDWFLRHLTTFNT